MTIKGIIAALALLALWVMPLPAGQAGNNEQRMEQAQERLQQFKERLKLTPEQTEQVRPILVEQMQKMKAVRDKHSGDQGRRARRKMGRELHGIQKDTDEKLKKILSREQMDELKKMREERRQEFRERAKK